MVDDNNLYLVCGGDGLIGKSIVKNLSDRKLPFISSSRRANTEKINIKIDLSDPLTFDSIPQCVKTAFICAGKTSILECDNDPVGTRLINVDNTIRLGELLLSQGAHLVIISTNLVYSGNDPFASPDDRLEPQCEYAYQKYEIDKWLENTKRGSILRITKIVENLENLIVGWSKDLQKGIPISPFADVSCSPISLQGVSSSAIDLGVKQLPGIFQLSGNKDITYSQIAYMVADFLKVNSNLVRPIKASDSNVTRAVFPKHTTLRLRIGISDTETPYEIVEDNVVNLLKNITL